MQRIVRGRRKVQWWRIKVGDRIANAAQSSWLFRLGDRKREFPKYGSVPSNNHHSPSGLRYSEICRVDDDVPHFVTTIGHHACKFMSDVSASSSEKSRHVFHKKAPGSERRNDAPEREHQVVSLVVIVANPLYRKPLARRSARD